MPQSFPSRFNSPHTRPMWYTQDLALDLIDRASKEGSFIPDQPVSVPPDLRPLDHSGTQLEDSVYSLCFLAARMGQVRMLDALVHDHDADWDTTYGLDHVCGGLVGERGLPAGPARVAGGRRGGRGHEHSLRSLRQPPL